MKTVIVLFFTVVLAGACTKDQPIEDVVTHEEFNAKYENKPRLAIRDARVYIGVNQNHTAISLLEQVDGDERIELRRLFHLARAFAKIQEFDKAIDANDQILEMREDHLPAIYNNACYVTLSSEGSDEEEIQVYLGLLKQQLDQKPHRVKHYMRMLQRDKDFVSIREKEWFANYIESLDDSSAQDTFSSEVEDEWSTPYTGNEQESLGEDPLDESYQEDSQDEFQYNEELIVDPHDFNI